MVPTRAVAVLVPLLLVVSAPATAQESTNQAGTPRFEAAPCPFKGDETTLAQVRCGYLIVPENRARPGGRQLKLAVAVAKNTSATPRPDAVVLLSGGPGDSFVQNTTRLMNVVMDGLRVDRDLIIWDQRGTGYSEPAFCPELRARWRGIAARGLSPSERLTQRRHAAADCRQAMLRQEVDLSQYNTLVSAHDLEGASCPGSGQMEPHGRLVRLAARARSDAARAAGHSQCGAGQSAAAESANG